MMVLRKSPINTLYYGDNLNILRRYIKDESVGEVFGELSRAALEPTVDLVYLNPPFNSNRRSARSSASSVEPLSNRN